MDINNLGLGTAQFGMPYGVANRVGRVEGAAASQILGRARAMGITLLDTAIAYGDSESRLGEMGVTQWQVVSKLPPVPYTGKRRQEWVRRSVCDSLERLRIPRLSGLLLHAPRQLLETGGGELYTALVSLKEAGLVEKIGLSVYAPDELSALVPRFEVDLIQAPFNVMDRRLATSGWLSRLRDLRVEVHVRSIFLQGLLLMKSAQRPEKFMRWRELWNRWDRWLEQQSVTALQACLSMPGHYAGISRTIVGVDGLEQLDEILTALTARVPEPPPSLACEDLDLIDPSRWN